MSQKKKRAVIIGLGNIGFKFSRYHLPFHTTHFETYRANPMIDLVAVADSDRIALRAVGRVCSGHRYADYRELLKREQPEIVSVCTPDQTHFPIIQALLRTPSVRGIWCEKPLSVSLDEARKMVADCEKRGVKLLVNFVRRYDPFYRLLKKRLKSLMGEIQTISCYYSGGILTSGSHLLDILSFLLGPCEEVIGAKMKRGVAGRLRFGRVWVDLIPLATEHYSILEMNIFGSRARLDTVNKPFGEYEYRYYLKQKDSVLGLEFIAGKTARPLPQNLPRNYMDLALKDLLKSIRQKQNPCSSGKTALTSLELIHALLYSSEAGGETISLPFHKKLKNLPQSGGDLKRLKL